MRVVDDDFLSRPALPRPRLVKGNRRRGGVIPHYIFATARNGLSIYTGRRALGRSLTLTLVAPLGGSQSSR